MNSLIKITFASIALALLAGCSLPKVEDKVEKGTIEKAVDVRGMQQSFRDWTVENYKFRVQIFTDTSGQTYDEDGVKATPEGYRVLANGAVCKPTGLALLRAVIWNFGDLDRADCFLDAKMESDDQSIKVFAMGLGAGAAVGVAGVLAGATVASGTNLVSNAINEQPIKKIGYVRLGKVE